MPKGEKGYFLCPAVIFYGNQGFIVSKESLIRIAIEGLQQLENCSDTEKRIYIAETLQNVLREKLNIKRCQESDLFASGFTSREHKLFACAFISPDVLCAKKFPRGWKLVDAKQNSQIANKEGFDLSTDTFRRWQQYFVESKY